MRGSCTSQHQQAHSHVSPQGGTTTSQAACGSCVLPQGQALGPARLQAPHLPEWHTCGHERHEQNSEAGCHRTGGSDGRMKPAAGCGIWALLPWFPRHRLLAQTALDRGPQPGSRRGALALTFSQRWRPQASSLPHTRAHCKQAAGMEQACITSAMQQLLKCHPNSAT